MPVIVGDKIYFYGGVNASGIISNSIWTASVANPLVVGDSGKTLPCFGVIYQPSQIQVIGSKVYFYGGEQTVAAGSSTYSASQFIFTASVGSPHIVGVSVNTPLPTKLGSHVVYQVGSTLYAALGHTGSGVSAAFSSSLYAPVSNPTSWSFGSNSTDATARTTRGQIIQIGNTFYVYCGFYSGVANSANLRLLTASVNSPMLWGVCSVATVMPVWTDTPGLISIGQMHYWFGGGSTTGSSGRITAFSASAPYSAIDLGVQFQDIGGAQVTQGGAVVCLPPVVYTGSQLIIPVYMYGSLDDGPNGISNAIYQTIATASLISTPTKFYDYSYNNPLKSIVNYPYEVEVVSNAEYAERANYLAANIVAPWPAYQQGVMFWDSSSGTFNYYNDIGPVTIGQTEYVTFYNASPNNMVIGHAVYFSGSTYAGYPNAFLAQADGTSARDDVSGVVSVATPIGTFGYATTAGLVKSASINLLTGSILFLSATSSGSYSTTPPTGSFEKTIVGLLVASGSGTSIIYVNPISQPDQADTASYAYYGPIRTGLNVMTFGAKGDSVTDDTTAIQNAISFSLAYGVGNRGVDLYFPQGVYRTSHPISCSGNNVMLVGAGVGSTALYPQHTTGDVLQFGNGGGTGTAFVGFENMSIICPTTRSSGATVNVNGANDVLIRNFTLSGYSTAINITGSSIKVRVDTGDITNGQSGSGVAINISNGLAGDTYISNIVTSNSVGQAPAAGIRVSQTGHTSLIRNNITGHAVGLQVNPVASQDVSYLFCDHNLFDSCVTNAASFQPAASATARIRSFVAVDSWFAGTISGSGIIISGSASGGSIDDLRFMGCRILNNYAQGIAISSSVANNIAIDNCTIAGNSQQSSSQWYGIEVAPNVSYFGITNCKIGQAGTAGNTQRGAVSISAGSSSFFRISDNDFGNNVIQPNIANPINLGAQTGTGSYINDNVGDATSGVADFVLATTAATSGTGETLLFKVPIPANSVRVGQTFRIKMAGASSSTGTLIFRTRIGTAGTTGDAQAWISTTSAAQVANAHAGFDILMTVRSIGTAGTVIADGSAHAGAVMLPTLIGAPATAAVNTTVTEYIDVTCTCSVGTFTAQVGVIEAL